MEEHRTKLSVRLNEKEYSHLRKQSELAGLKMEPFIRKLIMGTEICPRPPDEYRKILYQLSAIGNSVNQIAHIANIYKTVSEQKINEAVELVDKAVAVVKEWK